MIVTNDYLYTAQYCPAMEDLAGSSIFNNLSLNQFTFSKTGRARRNFPSIWAVSTAAATPHPLRRRKITGFWK